MDGEEKTTARAPTIMSVLDKVAELKQAEVKEFEDTLRNDRLIQIFVGTESKPYLVQQTVLHSISEYFVRALKNEALFGGPEGVLKFPEDQLLPWQYLLQWKITGNLSFDRLPEKKLKCIALIQCWILGGRLDVKEFQDEIMYLLIQLFSNYNPSFEIMKPAFENTPVGCPLRTLMAEEIAYGILGHSHVRKPEELDHFDGVIGFISDLMQIILKRRHEVIGERAEDIELMKAYIVGRGPKKYAFE